ncbi:hypothetical protein [Altererythrobacter sp. Z27]|uniref:hypothetical protein n=1 Tax=Altererythrobacter sp. Z27 TaxID=3461147 RepID=UPI004044FA64
MGRLGIGFPAGRRRRAQSDGTVIATIQPGATWNGTPGSGFGTIPADPVRTTAKPGLQLLVPPRQRFTESLTVGVLAMANNQGSLLANLGLRHVRVHYEGGVHDIAAPSLHRFVDVNGVERAYFGWWITLEHNGSHGEAQVYFEAVPADPTMQNRVIGPFSFFPAAQMHDYQIEIAPSQPVLTNQRYQTITAAGNALRTLNAQHPRILITEPGSYDLTPINATYVGAGYCTIEASVPVTIAKASYVPASGSGATNGLLRLRYDGLWFRGANITFDFANVHYIYHESPANIQHVFEGVNFTDSNGRGALWLKGQKPTFYACRDNPYFLECSVSVVQNAFLNASLVRGCDYSDGAHDSFSYARCVVSNRVTGHHNADWRAPLDAMTVQYSGAAATATIELSGANDANNRVFTAKENGGTISTFTVRNTDADFNAGTNYDVADVVAWLNGLTGWHATLLDDTRRTTSLIHASAATLGGSFGAVDTKTAPVTFQTVFDVHGDMWAINNASSRNGIFYSNLMFGNDLPIMGFGASGSEDMFFVNNAAHTDESINPYFANQISQWNRPGSQIVVAHNSLANQKFLLRAGMGMTADAWSLVANNCMLGIEWDGSPAAALPIAGNHIHAGQPVPAGSVGTSSGGDQASLFADASTGDFTPAGSMLANRKPPVVKHDRTGRTRRSTSASAGSEA